MKKKEMVEARNKLVEEMQAMVTTAEQENRAFSAEEQTSFDEKEAEVKKLDSTIESAERARSLKVVEAEEDKVSESQEEIEIRAFANIIRQRSGDSNITKSDNSSVIPVTIAKKIIDKIYDISPLFGVAEKFNVKGNVEIPYVSAANDNITVAYASEFSDLEAKSMRLSTIPLAGHLAGVLCKVSRSLLNNTDIDLANFVIEKIATAAANFIDHEILVGTVGTPNGSIVPIGGFTDSKILGLAAVSQVKTATSSSAITMDELLTVKNKVKSAFQKNAFWVMSPSTWDAVQHLKDGDQRYQLNMDPVKDFSGSLFGKPVYTSDQCPDIASATNVVFYGDFGQGLAAKIVEDNIQVLNERYATQHALGIVYWAELDAKIQNQQAIAALKMGS